MQLHYLLMQTHCRFYIKHHHHICSKAMTVFKESNAAILNVLEKVGFYSKSVQYRFTSLNTTQISFPQQSFSIKEVRFNKKKFDPSPTR